jgi:hypothetical protein
MHLLSQPLTAALPLIAHPAGLGLAAVLARYVLATCRLNLATAPASHGLAWLSSQLPRRDPVQLSSQLPAALAIVSP